MSEFGTAIYNSQLMYTKTRYLAGFFYGGKNVNIR